MADERLNNRVNPCWTVAAALLLVVVVSAGLPGCGKSGEPAGGGDASEKGQVSETPKTQRVELAGKPFTLELALDNDSRMHGLSDRKSIADDGGMLFVFPEPEQTQFVMRRCYVPIDLIFIDDDGYIDSLHRMKVIEPIGGEQWMHPTTGYASVGSIQFVIELKGGTLDKLGLKRGDRIDLPRDQLQSMAQ